MNRNLFFDFKQGADLIPVLLIAGIAKQFSFGALPAHDPKANFPEPMYYIGLDVHKRKISYSVKDSSGKVYAEGSLPATRMGLDHWMKKFESADPVGHQGLEIRPATPD